MTFKRDTFSGHLPFILFSCAFLSGLVWISTFNFLLFHGLVEVFSIAVAWSVFVIAWNSREVTGNTALTFLGIAYLYIGSLDLLHTFAYKGMGVFPGYGANLPTQFWVVARYAESLSLLAAPLVYGMQRSRAWVVMTAGLGVTALLVAAVFLGLVPDCFVEGSGLTRFKIVSEWVISGLFILAGVHFYLRRELFDPGVLKYVYASLAFSVAAEMAFTTYISVYGGANAAGHFLRAISYFLIYKGLTEFGLRRPQEALFRDLTHQAEELRLAKVQAEAATEAKAAFLDNVSHEIRTPLNGLLGMGELLAKTDLSPEQKDRLHTMNNSAHSLLTIVNDLLDFSKIESGKLEVEKVSFDMRQVLDTSLEPLRTMAGAKGIGFVLSGDDRIPRALEGDPTRISQILVNLVGNAIKFTEIGHVAVDLGCTVVRPGRARLDITVSDTGCGIPEDSLNEIMTPFTQADSSITRKFGGTGLGLSIVSALVQAMEGTITLSSREGEGTVVQCRIMVGVPEPVAAGEDDLKQPLERSTAGLRPLNVLVAEDNLVNRKVMQAMLRELGHSCLLVEDGAQALYEFAPGRFDLVLMDLQMPIMDGFMATRAIRGSEKNQGVPETPVYAVTASPQGEIRHRCLVSGMNGLLSKPYSMEQLRVVLGKCAGPA